MSRTASLVENALGRLVPEQVNGRDEVAYQGVYPGIDLVFHGQPVRPVKFGQCLP